MTRELGTPPFVHPTAVVDPGAILGSGTRVWHFCHVTAGARVGQDCVLGQGCFVAATAVLGDRVHVQNHVSIYDGVVIEDDVFCGPSMVFTNVQNPRSAVPRRDEYRQTLVRRGATIGANATITPGVTLGAHCFVAAGAVVTHDVRPFELVAGVPARCLGWMSRHGQRLSFDESGRATCPATGEHYRLTSDGDCALGNG